MTTILFLFALLTTPHDRYICDMWTRAITQEGMAAACGTLQLAGYRVDLYDLDMKLVCQRDAIYLNNFNELMIVCDIPQPYRLDDYVLRIVQPGWTELICTVKSEHEDLPTEQEVREQCPEGLINFKTGAYSIAWKEQVAPKEETPFTCPARSLSIGPGLYQQVPGVDYLATDQSLTWLAGKLIWTGQVKVTNCYGNGLDPYTLAANPCGMAQAKSKVYQWQNQFDAEIYSAARAYNVPAKLLKRMMSIESQFWPYYIGDANEIGIMQVTDNGLDALLRFDTAIDPTYHSRDDQNKAWSRNVTRQLFTCINCNLEKAIAHIKIAMPTYARLLAAFHCRAVTINPALFGDLAWRQAVVDYNGSTQYLERIER
jgi:hypothetical protein